ncbi:related to dehydrogenases and related proteins [Cephalotrichum gorgonifer]|uniref:Related to dehydrogenases and related proteins n=1 Tax=Cephalotrichum gorgonifer TaxID=2041049 RepID=A0AAE8MWN9_9PEZI|nr:related to dehydrogenases and related proteins [Cephalotrichum gorgonifer]
MPSPRFLVIGAGARGHAYAQAMKDTNAVVAAVAEPIPYKRRTFGKTYVWPGSDAASEGQEFTHWDEFVAYETARRERAARGDDVPPGVDGVFVCVLDEAHRDVVVALAPLNLHVMCEKPLATSLEDCIDIYRAIRPQPGREKKIFSIGHVLRYSPHNVLLRKLLVEDRVVGDICSVEHTEPVGWWHFTHSYVRGNWRNEDVSSPSLLAKSCHDIDLLLWLLSSPAKAGEGVPHLPSTVTSSGTLQLYKKSRKPRAAGTATNCLKCPLGDEGCKYSAKKIYIGPDEQGVETGNTGWPLSVVLPEIEDMPTIEERKSAVLKVLEQDYDQSTPAEEVAAKKWFGRCVFESDNNVVDDQFVTMTWDDEPVSSPATPPLSTSSSPSPPGASPSRYAKTATLHMVANTKKICQRYTSVYGTDGELHADSKTITVIDFTTGETKTHTPPTVREAGHGGGDQGLTRQFVGAVDAVINGGARASDAQAEFIGCTIDDVLRSHAMVFAAEKARTERKVLDWGEWWSSEIEGQLA